MTTTRKRTDERRQQVALAALRILGQGGRKALTTATLAEDVGVTTGAIFRHFSSMEDVLRAAVRVAIERVEATFPDDELGPLERVMALAGNRVRVLGGDPGIAWLLRSEQASVVLPPDVMEELQDLVRRSRKFLRDALREGAAEGTIRDDVGAEHLLVVVMGTIHSLIGAAGVHGAARRSPPASAMRTLEALRVLISAPAGGPRRSGRKRRQNEV